MPSLVTVTIQSALLKAAANITAQTLAARKSQTNTPFDWARVLEFAFFWSYLGTSHLALAAKTGGKVPHATQSRSSNIPPQSLETTTSRQAL
jgi:hypothetical protein